MEPETIAAVAGVASAWHVHLGGDGHRLDLDIDGRGRSDGRAW